MTSKKRLCGVLRPAIIEGNKWSFSQSLFLPTKKVRLISGCFDHMNGLADITRTPKLSLTSSLS